NGEMEMKYHWLIFLILFFALNNTSALLISESHTDSFSTTTDHNSTSRSLITLPEFNQRLGTLQSTWLSVDSATTANWNHGETSSVNEGSLVSQRNFTQTYNTQFGYGGGPIIFESSESFNCSAESCNWGPHDNVTVPVETNTGTLTSNQYGGPIPYTVTSSVYPPERIGSIMIDGTATVIYEYETKTKDQYISDAITSLLSDQTTQIPGENPNPITGQLTPKQIADRAYNDIITLRRSSPQTSSLNLDLRDAEYYLRGYSGAQAWNDPSSINVDDWFNELANGFSPISTNIYNGINIIKEYFGENISGDDDLPGTPPGGYFDNLEGFSDGINNLPLEILIIPPEDSSEQPEDSTGTNTTDLNGNSNNVLNFTNEARFAFEGYDILGSFINITNANPDQFYLFDPVATDLYSYSLANNFITGMYVPSGQGFTDFTVNFNNFNLNWIVDDVFDFTGYYDDGISSLLLSDFNNTLAFDDLVVGFRFATADPATLFSFRANEPYEASSVPEPSTLLLLGAGIVGIGATRLKRKTT
ncbi:MAG: PEP-CTERM sorting domain-containing protein, partial [Candidatus Thiodiazotropha sp.]